MAEEPEETYIVNYIVNITASNCTINITQTGKPDNPPPPPPDPDNP